MSEERPAEQRDVATAVAEFFRLAGIRRVYGVPGEDHLHLLHTLERAGIEYVLARQESAACIMAGAEAQVTGLPGVCIVGVAPGLANAINGIANAYLDRLPLIVITGQHARSRFPIVSRQSLDNHELVRGVTKWSLTMGQQVEQVLNRVMDVALAQPCGPVFLELSEDVATQPAAPSDGRWHQWKDTGIAGGPGPEMDRVRDLLASARRPVLLLGGGQYSEAERGALLELAEQSAGPILTSAAAKGAVPAAHPLFAGTFLGGNLEAKILGRSDLLIMVSLSATEFYNRPWPYQAPIVTLNRAHNTQGFLPLEAEASGDLALLAKALTGSSPGRSEWTRAEVAEYRALVSEIFASPAGALTIAETVRRVRAKMPPDTFVTADAGFSKPIINLVWDTDEPDSYFASHGLSTMGYALPAANALQLLHPGRRTVAFMGDGSLLMRATEISVASALGLAPIYIVFLDGTMSQIAVKQERRKLALVGAHFPAPCAEDYARAFGGQGFDVETPDQLDAALDAALSGTVPSLIGVHFDDSDRARLFETLRG